MSKEDLIGWIGSVFFCAGAVLLAYHFVLGFGFNFVGNACYLFQGYWARLPSLMILSGILAALNCFAVSRWLILAP